MLRIQMNSLHFLTAGHTGQAYDFTFFFALSWNSNNFAQMKFKSCSTTEKSVCLRFYRNSRLNSTLDVCSTLLCNVILRIEIFCNSTMFLILIIEFRFVGMWGWLRRCRVELAATKTLALSFRRKEFSMSDFQQWLIISQNLELIS